MPRAAASSLLILCLLAGGLRADPFTSHPDALIAELELRRDNDFGGTLDKLAKKQQKAVLVSLAQFAKASSGPMGDLKALGKAGKKLAKAYASEFDPASLDQTLSGLVFGAVLGLRDDAVARRADNLFLAPTLSPGGLVKKATQLNGKAGAILGTFVDSTDALERVKITTKATGLLDKVDKLSAKDKGTGEYLVYGKVGATPLLADAPFAEWHGANDELQVFGSYTNPKTGSVASVAVIMEGVTGPGTYPFSGGGWSGFYEVGSGFNVTTYDIVPGSGSLVVEELDIVGSVVEGTFAFDGHNDGNNVTLVFDDCRFRLTDVMVP